ncbi:PAS domain S-box-containing protein [Sulfitobacter brevis]|uniref:histidine kinase n=1 Tax=Sulfitobacter brevis TaxID=74348 RepID=A0A1I1Z6L7_9RHOB|nr:histidine kinase dimerization/phosphoacceptor domain -containing protein [Sulfitobacter brevis]SFE27381.1 PAS domain S-box-containing protein [Sulfitobacter brevis]
MAVDALIDVGLLFDAAPIAQIVLDSDLHIVAANLSYCAMIGRGREELIGKNAYEIFKANPDDPDADNEAALQATVLRVLGTGVAEEMTPHQHDIQDADGHYTVRHWQLTVSPVFTDSTKPDVTTHALICVEDVTKAVLGLRINEAKSRAAMRGTDITYFEFDYANHTLERTPQLDAMFGFDHNETGNDVQPFFERIYPDDLPAINDEIERVVRTVGSNYQNDYRSLWPDGTVRWLMGRGESIRDPQTQSILIVGVVLDVTDFKLNEARLQSALDTQNLLMSEVNHRVKNSLQMVSSILNLEAQQTKDAVARDVLRAATARVHAVAAIHASLYDGEDLESVRLDTYLERLKEHLITSLSSEGTQMRIILDVEPIRLSTDKAVTLSLAVNELVTNSFKHGTWADGQGTVKVWLRRHDNNKIALDVIDNGTQRADGPLVRETTPSGLGTRLIAGMAAQLNGKIEEDHTDGWRTRIIFPG